MTTFARKKLLVICQIFFLIIILILSFFLNPFSLFLALFVMVMLLLIYFLFNKGGSKMNENNEVFAEIWIAVGLGMFGGLTVSSFRDVANRTFTPLIVMYMVACIIAFVIILFGYLIKPKK